MAPEALCMCILKCTISYLHASAKKYPVIKFLILLMGQSSITRTFTPPYGIVANDWWLYPLLQTMGTWSPLEIFIPGAFFL